MGNSWNYDKPLEIYGDETAKANEHLQAYYRMGSDRSLAKLERLPECTVCLKQLQNYSVAYEWQSRVKRQFAIDSEAIHDALLEQRIEVLKEFCGLIFDAIEGANTQGASVSQVASAVKVLVDGFNAVFDSQPTKRLQVTNMNDLKFEDVLKQLQDAVSVEK